MYTLIALFDFGRLCVTYFTNGPFESGYSNIPSPRYKSYSLSSCIFFTWEKDPTDYLHSSNFLTPIILPGFF